jgi:hypothetical protein
MTMNNLNRSRRDGGRTGLLAPWAVLTLLVALMALEANPWCASDEATTPPFSGPNSSSAQPGRCTPTWLSHWRADARTLAAAVRYLIEPEPPFQLGAGKPEQDLPRFGTAQPTNSTTVVPRT